MSFLNCRLQWIFLGASFCLSKVYYRTIIYLFIYANTGCVVRHYTLGHMNSVQINGIFKIHARQKEGIHAQKGAQTQKGVHGLRRHNEHIQNRLLQTSTTLLKLP